MINISKKKQRLDLSTIDENRQLTQEELQRISLAELAKRELERRKIIRDILYFIENYVYIENKSGVTKEERSILFKLFPSQKRVLKSIQENKKNIILKARQLGMTWLVLAIGLHGSLAIQQFTVAILSQTEDYMKEAINRVEYIILRLPPWLITEYNKDTKQLNSMYLYEKKSDNITIYFPTGENGERIESTIKGFVSTEGAGRSITADLIIFDEWAYHDVAEAVFTAAYPTINRPDSGKFIGLSSNKRGTFFESIVKDALKDNLKKFNLIFLAWNADPRRTVAWWEETKAVLTNTWKQEYPATIEDALSSGTLTAFPEFSREIHVCEPFPIPDHWTKWFAVDNGLGGIRDPYVWIKGAISEDGTIYMYYEYSQEKGVGDIVYYSDQAERFMIDCKVDVTNQYNRELEDFHLGFKLVEEKTINEKLQYGVFGVDAFSVDKAKGTNKSLLDFYAEGGMNYPAIKATTDRKLRKDTLHEYLKPHPDGKGGQTAKLQIFNTCKYTINYIPELTVDENNPNVVADNSKIDNVYDCLTYLILGRPDINSKPLPVEENKLLKYKNKKIKELHSRKNRKGVIN